MNIVYILDKAKAEHLADLGFKYTEKNIDNKKTYLFFGTDLLMKELNSNFESGSFFIGKNLCL